MRSYGDVSAVTTVHLDMPDIVELMEETDERLFGSTLNNPHHTLHALLPPQSTTSQNYQLRQRVHD